MNKVELEGKALHPVIYKINIISLKSEYRRHFKERFPAMTLTSIGAVDIHDISRHPKENEVILRGPYTLILDIFEDQYDMVGYPCHVLDALVITSNRDHITTSQPGPEDDLARDMFAAMVTVTRSEYVMRYYREKGLDKEADECEQTLEAGRCQLEALWSL